MRCALPRRLTVPRYPEPVRMAIPPKDRRAPQRNQLLIPSPVPGTSRHHRRYQVPAVIAGTRYQPLSVDTGCTNRLRAEMAGRRSVRITIYVDADSLRKLKALSAESGVPYQRLRIRILKEHLGTADTLAARVDRIERELARLKRTLAARDEPPSHLWSRFVVAVGGELRWPCVFDQLEVPQYQVPRLAGGGRQASPPAGKHYAVRPELLSCPAAPARVFR